MNNAILIDPSTESVEAVELVGPAFLDAAREHLQVPQINCAPVADARMCVWFDQMGMLKPGRAFWRFADSDFRFAGRCLLTSLRDGMPCPIPRDLTPEKIREGIRFHPAEDLVRIQEDLVIVPDAEGRPVPAVARRVIWRDPVELPTVPDQAESVEIGEREGWTVYERDDGTYRVVRYRLRENGAGMEPVELHTYPNLDAARGSLPGDLVRIEPSEAEHPDTVEHWLAKKDAPPAG